MPIEEYEKIANYLFMMPNCKEGILKLQSLTGLSYEEALFYVQSYKDLDYYDSKTLNNDYLDEKRKMIRHMALSIKNHNLENKNIHIEKIEKRTFQDYVFEWLFNPDILEAIKTLSVACNFDEERVKKMVLDYKEKDHRHLNRLENQLLLQEKLRIISIFTTRMQERIINNEKRNR